MLQEIPEAAVAALKAGDKVLAVRITRDANGTTLKTSLEAIEDYLARTPSVNGLYTQMRAQVGRKYLLMLKIGLVLLLAAAVAGYFAL